MVLLGLGSLGVYPIGGYIVHIGDVSSPYTPDFTYSTEQEFKDTWGVMDSNYYVEGATTPEDDPFWNPYNQDPTYSFTVVQQLTGGSKRYFTGGIGMVLGV